MAMLVYADSDGVEHSFTVGTEVITVGRANECAIRSSDPRVSRNHARFWLDQTGTLYVEDLGSSNGVFVGQHKVAHSAVPAHEMVMIGSLTFRFVPAPPPMAPPQEWAPPPTQPASDVYQPSPAGNPAELEHERKARQAAEEERDAYGARMAELHQELRDLRQKLAEKDARMSEMPQYSGELDLRVGRIAELEDLVKDGEGRVKALEEQLAQAQAEVTAAEDRIVSEIAAHEQRSAAELASRVEELEVSRADLVKAEERIVELTRKVSELEEKLGRF